MLYDGYCLTVEPHHRVKLVQDGAGLDVGGLVPMLFAASCPEALTTYSSSRPNENATCRAHIEKFINLQVGIPDEVKPGVSFMTSSPMTCIKGENYIAKELSAPIPVTLSSSKRKHQSDPPQPCSPTKKRVNPASPTKLTAVGA